MIKSSQKGFSLVEVCLTIVVTAMISLTVASIVQTSANSYDYLSSEHERLQKAYFIIDRIARELRLCGNNCLTAIADDRVDFLDKDNIPANFRLVGTTLNRGFSMMAEGIGSLHFDYYDQNRAVTAVPGDVRLIEIQIGLAHPGQAIEIFSTRVFLRNYYYASFE
jgi:type II secretory pathway pseudopilin PulG